MDDPGLHGRQGAPSLQLAAAASAAAGLVHAAAAGTHNGDTTLTTLFAVTAAVQLGWAVLAVAYPRRGVAVLGTVLGATAVGAWVLSRTAGLPLIDALGDVEEVGLQDGIAAALGLLAAVASAAAALGLQGPRTVRRAPTAVVGALAIVALAVPGVAAQHTHGPSHEHGGEHGDDHRAAAGDHHADGAHAGGGAHHAGEDPADEAGGGGHGAAHDAEPIISLADPRVTDAQRAAAQQLIDDTTAGMARFTDVASVEAAGFVSIGDAPTGYEHFVNIANMADGRDLDPNAIESIVFKVYPDGTRQLASAMYILGFGATMDDVPDIAGELTRWHDHQDLCWEGVRVVGRMDERGQCRRGTFRGTAPMLHVWMVPHRCGPFAGIEGAHGSGCSHGHDEPAGATPEGTEEQASGS